MSANPSDHLAPRVRPDRTAPLHVEAILIGRDLLRGQVDDRNTRTLADAIAARGGLVHRVTVVDDGERAVAGALREALERNPHLVVTTGGLGPAADDRTVDAIAAALGRPIENSPVARKIVEEAYRRLYSARVIEREGLDRNREKLCRMPVGATPVANPIGTSPGVICRIPGGCSVLALPGKPQEMKAVLDGALPLLKDIAARGHVAQREIESPTADESSLRPLLDKLGEEYPQVRFSTRPVGFGRKGSKVLITLETVAANKEDAQAAIEAGVGRLLAIVSGCS